MEGDLQPSQRLSPDDLSSPDPDQGAPLLQVQQNPPSRAERDDIQPGSEDKMGREVVKTDAAKEGTDIQSSLTVADRERSVQVESDSGRGRTEEDEDCKDEEDADRDTCNVGLPLSKGSEDENEEESDRQKEPPDANNNSLEAAQKCQDDFLNIPEIPAQVSPRGCSSRQ